MPDTQVVERFQAWARVQGLSQAQAARRVGCSPATLSQVIAGKYAGDSARIVEKMSRALERAERRAKAPKRPPIVLTSVCEDVLDTLRIAHDEGVMAVVCGPSQVGKTSAVKLYCQLEPETVYCRILPTGHSGRARSSRPLLRGLAKVLGLQLPAEASNEDWVEAVGAALAGTGRLVIVDEIDYADENLLQAIRNLWDISQVGIVMVGTAAFLDGIRRKNSPTLNQVLRRIAYCAHVDGMTDEDAEKILAPYSLDRAALAVAREGAHGVSGRLALGIAGAQRIAAVEDGKLDAKYIARAYAMLMEV